MTASAPLVSRAVRFLVSRQTTTLRAFASHLRLRGVAGSSRAEELLRHLRWQRREDACWVPRDASRSWNEAAHHCARLLDQMRRGGVWVRADVVALLGVTKAKATSTLQILVRAGAVHRIGEHGNTLYYANKDLPPRSDRTAKRRKKR